MSDPGSLDRYRRKRDFSATPEPVGEEGGLAAGEDRARFVVQEHHARRLHWDLRLERDGVLASWAVPKGIPPDPGTNHLAVRTEDHPLLYLEFSGEIPKGNYGAGTMSIWDRGTYVCEKWSDREVMVVLQGERVSGRHVLFRTDGDQWMIHRMDPAADPDRVPLPDFVPPMWPTPGRLPRRQEDYGFEILWEGRRTLAYGEGGRVRLSDDRGDDVTSDHPALGRLGRNLGSSQVVLDGEMVELGPDGRPSPGAAPGRSAAYMVYDLLFLDGRPVIDSPYRERRDRLDALGLEGPAWRAPSFHVGDGEALLELAAAQGLNGVVAKRLDSPYRPGQRSADWVVVRRPTSL